jgi:hypothetical protein
MSYIGRVRSFFVLGLDVMQRVYDVSFYRSCHFIIQSIRDASSTPELWMAVYRTWDQAQAQGQVKGIGEPEFSESVDGVVMMPIPYCSFS